MRSITVVFLENIILCTSLFGFGLVLCGNDDVILFDGNPYYTVLLYAHGKSVLMYKLIPMFDVILFFTKITNLVLSYVLELYCIKVATSVIYIWRVFIKTIILRVTIMSLHTMNLKFPKFPTE